MRVMMADEDGEMLEVVSVCLQRRGHTVQIATNGLDLLAALSDFVPDVFVIDRDLRWCSFEAVLSALRHDPRLSAVPVIMVADWRTQYEAEANSNVVAWLQKPFHLAALLKAISSATGLPELCDNKDGSTSSLPPPVVVHDPYPQDGHRTTDPRSTECQSAS